MRVARHDKAKSAQIARPNAVMIQYMVLFSHRTVRLPSVVLSHQQEAAVCRPAPEHEGKGVHSYLGVC